MLILKRIMLMHLKNTYLGGIKVSSELDTIFTKETLSLAEKIYDSKSPIEQRICGVSLIAEILTRKGGDSE